jgi:predicted CoA-binding protein
MDPIRRVLEKSKIIAIGGASNNPARPSLEVARYLQESGYKIVPVNPTVTEFLGEECYPDLLSIPGPVDVVDIFRNPDAVPEIVEQAIQKQARVVWMQPGAENMLAAERAMEAGIEVIMGVCMMKEHRVVGMAQ